MVSRTQLLSMPLKLEQVTSLRSPQKLIKTLILLLKILGLLKIIGLLGYVMGMELMGIMLVTTAKRTCLRILNTSTIWLSRTDLIIRGRGLFNKRKVLRLEEFHRIILTRIMIWDMIRVGS